MNDNSQYNSSNPADGWFPRLDVMVAFWLWGLAAAIFGGIIIWLNGAPDTFKQDNGYITTWDGYAVLWVVYVAIMAILYGVFRSEGKGRIQSKIAGIAGALMTVFVIVYTILSVKYGVA